MEGVSERLASRLNFREIEAKWQKAWSEARIFEADPDPSRPKFYLTVAYPYPNSPQHIGHGRTYTLADVHARYRRMRGFNVLFPMGFHYTGTPIVAMAKRLGGGDRELRETFIRIYKVEESRLGELADPVKMARYFHEEIKRGMLEMGFSIDFRREFTTIDPHYNRFIEWQFQKLKELGLISQGSHPVGWCPNDGNPVGQHDTRNDVEPEIGEFTLIKFTLGGDVLPTGTLRPETVFGVTNIWVNPDAKYVRARVDGECWIVSRRCVEKLPFLGRKVEVLEAFEGKRLVGREAVNPATGRPVPVLPASFVDPGSVTGVVMSVPAHAPYDLVALGEVKARAAELAERYSLDRQALEALAPLPIIEVEGLSQIPASDIVSRMGIRGQDDPRLEDATREVYRREFHSGLMAANTGPYRGLRVSEAKENVRRDLIAAGKADTMFELLNRPVFCRCGAECVVKVFENQWFLDYGKAEWKRLAYECLDAMEILPEEMRPEFRNVVGWLREKACARRAGMGTPLPWDPSWIIESLSDSTIYMAYYILAKHVNLHGLPAEKLTRGFFDYVFLGKGDPAQLGEALGLSRQLLEAIRDEFCYFYPLDSRHSGRDLVSNHLAYFIFNHVALFPKAHWPRRIVVNGSVLLEGQKMSKSLGNITPLREAVATYSADALRMSLLATSSLLQDADFSVPLARSTQERLERFYAHALKVLSLPAERKLDPARLEWVDRWLLSRVQAHIQAVTEAMERLEVMKACQHALYLFEQDVQWYLRRVGLEAWSGERKHVVGAVLREALNVQLRLLAPVTPHLCEEVWSLMGNGDFVALAPWPEPEAGKVSPEAEMLEELLKLTIEDTRSILRATGLKPKAIYYYTAASWKWNVYLKTLQAFVAGEASVGKIMRELKGSLPDSPKIAEAAAKAAARFLDEARKTPREVVELRLRLGALPFHQHLRASVEFLAREFGAEVKVYVEDEEVIYDPKGRARLAEPYRPAIYLE